MKFGNSNSAAPGWGFAKLLAAAILAAACLAPWGQSSLAEEPAAGLDGYSFAPEHARQWKLPSVLDEISGLAATPSGRMFAHGDEWGIVYEFDPARERLVKAFALGQPSAADDFEGIAIADGRFYLVTSRGRIYEAPEGADGERVLYNTFDTGVGRQCEIEGLAYEPGDRTLLLACKNPLTEELFHHVAIFRWSVATRALVPGPPVMIKLDDLTAPLGIKSFQPSALERNPVTGTYILAAAIQHALAEIRLDGTVLSVRELPARHHRQIEGLTFGADLELVLADEGGGGRGRLTIYKMTERDGN